MVEAITLKYRGQQIYRAEAEADKILSKQFGFNGYGRTTEGNFPVYLCPQSSLIIIKGIAETGEHSLQAKIYRCQNETFEAEQIARSLQAIGFEEQAGFLKIAGRGLVNYVLAPLSYAADGFLSAVDRWTEQKVKLTELKPELKNIDYTALAGLSAHGMEGTILFVSDTAQSPPPAIQRIREESVADLAGIAFAQDSQYHSLTEQCRMKPKIATEPTTTAMAAAAPAAREVSAEDLDQALNHCLRGSALPLERRLPKTELDRVNPRLDNVNQRLDNMNPRPAGLELAPFPDQPALDQLITVKAVPVSPNYFQQRS